MKTRVLINQPSGYRSIWTWCPGCDSLHPFRVKGPNGETPPGDEPLWDWDGNEESPTFNPSLLIYSTVHLCGPGVEHIKPCPNPEECDHLGHRVITEDDGTEVLYIRDEDQPCKGMGNCHSFLHNGQWQFLGDSAHHLAGQTVPMVDLPGPWSED